MTPGVGIRGALPLGWTVLDATGQPANIVALTLVDITGAPVSIGGGGALPAAPITGQQTTTTSAVAMAANALANGIVITALSANTGTVYVGSSGVTAATGYPLVAGQSISFAVANTSGIYIIGTNTTDKISFAGN